MLSSLFLCLSPSSFHILPFPPSLNGIQAKLKAKAEAEAKAAAAIEAKKEAVAAKKKAAAEAKEKRDAEKRLARGSNLCSLFIFFAMRSLACFPPLFFARCCI